MQNAGKGRSGNREQHGSPAWIPNRNEKRAIDHDQEAAERPIPKPSSDLGFTGIRHKTTGRSLSHPSQPSMH